MYANPSFFYDFHLNTFITKGFQGWLTTIINMRLWPRRWTSSGQPTAMATVAPTSTTVDGIMNKHRVWWLTRPLEPATDTKRGTRSEKKPPRSTATTAAGDGSNWASEAAVVPTIPNYKILGRCWIRQVATVGTRAIRRSSTCSAADPPSHLRPWRRRCSLRSWEGTATNGRSIQAQAPRREHSPRRAAAGASSCARRLGSARRCGSTGRWEWWASHVGRRRACGSFSKQHKTSELEGTNSSVHIIPCFFMLSSVSMCFSCHELLVH